MPKPKKPAQPALFHPHTGSTSGSRTSNTYSSIGTQGYTHVTEARMQASKLPSRMGNNLHWPDGTTTETDHARQPTHD